MRTKNMILVALFAAMSAAGAFIKIPVGPVPISLQTLFTILAGIIIGPYLGALSQIIYIFIGLIGIPVFTSGGGPSYIFSPTFGFLLGFILSSFVSGTISSKIAKNSFLKYIIACIAASASVYLIGVPYMYLIMKYSMNTNISFFTALKTGCILFIPGDIAKSLLASIIAFKTVPVLKKMQH
ncbi:MAG TPA: biotin transporter BioY [Ruminiclostridium sp.]|nr:biotin transporter BioY [Ruminiclostridium sp.]